MDSKNLSIAQVVEITGLPASTIRYYDQQLGEFLEINRGKGRRRNFSARSVELLQQVHGWLKNEGLSLRQVRMRLNGNNESGKAGPQLDKLYEDMAKLRREVDELKDIQQRTLSILAKLTN